MASEGNTPGGAVQPATAVEVRRMNATHAVSPGDALLAALVDRVEALDEWVRRIDATIQTATRSAGLPAAETKPAIVPSALTPPVLPWPVRGQTPPPRAWSALADVEMLRAAVGLTTDAVVGVDAAGLVRLWNRAAEVLFGWPTDAVLGSPPPFLPTDRVEEHAELVHAGRAVEVTTVRRRNGGDLLAVRAAVAPVAGGAVFAFRPAADAPPIAVVSPDPATERFAALGRTVAGVAHDFNNLIAVVQGHAEILAEQFDPGSPQRESAEAIVATADTAAGVSRRLLGVARPDPDDPIRTDVNLLLTRLERLVRSVVGGKVTTSLTLATDLRPVAVHPADLTQVVLNLVTNARDAMPDGGTLTLRTACQPGGPDRRGWPADVPAGEFVVLTVADTGIGMDEATRPRVFDPLFTTKGEGTGLGLMAVREIVTRAGGHVEFDSEPGWGTQARVYLPRA
jgi:PAS domain S-box-containing protein